MATVNGTAASGAGEETPLLREERMGGNVNGAGGANSDISSSPREPRGHEDIADSGKANQQVGRIRGLLIILSLWGLIFLQGEFLGCESRLVWRNGKCSLWNFG
jgi:hypothetical protein